jgi:hypothetical protein
MTRGTLVLAVFVLIALGIIGASALLQNQPPLQLTVAVDPMIAGWARESAKTFNASRQTAGAGRRVEVTITEINDYAVWGANASAWSATTHPDAWIPSSSLSVEYARGRGLMLEVVEASLAQTPLIWGGYTTRVNLIVDSPTAALNSQQVARAAAAERWDALDGQASWGFVKLAIALPNQTMSGLGMLLVSAADFYDTAQLSGAQLTSGEFRKWLTPIIASVSNFNSIGSDAAAFVARGVASADLGMAAESQWLRSLDALTRTEPVRFSYPQYAFVFDFPLARWNDANVTDDQRQAVTAFQIWLMSAQQQAALPSFGIRSRTRMVTDADSLFVRGVPYGIKLNPTFDTPIQPLSLTDVNNLLHWFQTVRR